MARRLEFWQVQEVSVVLNALGVEQLQAGLRLLGDTTKGKKADLVAAMETHLEDEGLAATYGRLDENERAVISEVVHGDGTEFYLAQFRAKYGFTPKLGGRGRGLSSTAGPGLLDLFFYHGRTMPSELKTRLLESGMVETPRAVQMASEESPPETIELAIPEWRREPETETSVPVRVREMERSARHDLLAVLRMVAAGEIGVTPKGRVPSAAVQERIADVLDGGDFYPDPDDGVGPIRGFAWPLLLQVAGLAKPAGRKLALTKRGTAALAAPPEVTIRSIWTRWRASREFDELRRVERIRGQTGKGKRNLTSVAGRRLAVSRGLTGCPAGRWVEVDEFFRYLRAADCGLMVSRNLWDLYFTDPNYGSLAYDGCGTFEVLEGRYTLANLFEYAATLGLVDVAYVRPHDARSDFHGSWGVDEYSYLSRYDGLVSIRMTNLGRFALDLLDTYTPAEREPRNALHVLPTLEVVIRDEVADPGDVFALDRFGKRAGERVWRLSQAKLLQAVSSGQPAADLERFLTERTAEPLPTTVLDLIRRAEERSAALVPAGPALLIECRDPETAALIAHDRVAGRHCLPCGERHLAVPVQSEKKFRKALEKLGYPFPTGPA